MEHPESIHDLVRLPCPSCGNQLHYSAQHQKLNCSYCGYAEEYSRETDKIVENSLAEAAHSLPEYAPEERGQKVFDCQSCGAKFMVASDTVRVNCGFCGSSNVNLEAYRHQYIQPQGIIPFLIAKVQAEDQFKKWIRQGWFHPNKLKKLAEIDSLHGIYIPFWTFDAQTHSQWSGEAGHYYYETVMVSVNGRMQPKQVQKVRWTYRSGSLSHFFDDVLVNASGGLEQREIQRIYPYRLQEAVNFDPRLILGWESEVYSLEIDRGYQIAESEMDAQIRGMCSSQLGGDTQRNLRIQTQKSNQTFKHVVLPLWICAYRYQNQTYRFFINGQTGKVAGKKPISWIKIAILVLLFALFIAGIYFLRESGVLN
jgi:predicted RNA-binding Zn-ribbon protein involved in translation (DUF1610 family)